MTQKELEKKLRIAIEKAKIVIMNQCPVRTGLLKSSIRITTSSNGYKIYVDTNAAPHMVFTEEPWTTRPRTNPNQGWFAEAVEMVFQLLKIELSGTGKRNPDPTKDGE